MPKDVVLINRAPVLTLWAAVVAEQMGFERKEALSLGKCLAGLNAQSKGRSLGIFKPAEAKAAAKKAKRGEELWVEICGRPVPAKNTDAGVRAVAGDMPIDPAPVEKYLAGKFGDSIDRVRDAMTALAQSLSPDDLAARAYSLYEQFRPRIPPGTRGWGAKGELDLDRLRSVRGKLLRGV